jgi:branched-chain amino acid transport system permease protein
MVLSGPFISWETSLKWNNFYRTVRLKLVNEFIIFALHGVSYSGLLFLIASGLTIVFGMMGVLNFAHASFYMVGAYLSFTVFAKTGQFWLSLILCPIMLFIVGCIVERFLIRKVHSAGMVYDLLLTFGLGYVLGDIVKWVWGTMPLRVTVSGILADSVTILGLTYPIYRLFILFVSIIICIIMALILFKTKLGIIIRAAVDDNEMCNALGTNIPLIFNGVFGFGASLAALAGVIAGPLLTISADMANLVLLDAFVVVIVGGLGSLVGGILAALIIGQLQSFGVLLIPKISMVLIYVLMAVVLIFKPSGLLGKRE